MKKKTIALILSCVLVLGCAIGGTIAWLTDKTQSVTNTFTVGNVDITLQETDTTHDNVTGNDNKSFKMIPGTKLAKDPSVTVKHGSEACWLFVKVDESTNLDEFISYTVDQSWTAGEGTGDGKNGVPVGVYFREVSATDAANGITYNVLTSNTTYTNGYVTVKADVTKEMMDGLNTEGATQPTLTFTAYAVQRDGVDSAAEAWAKVTP